jgi:hypothetical protein
MTITWHVQFLVCPSATTGTLPPGPSAPVKSHTVFCVPPSDAIWVPAWLKSTALTCRCNNATTIAQHMVIQDHGGRARGGPIVSGPVLVKRCVAVKTPSSRRWQKLARGQMLLLCLPCSSNCLALPRTLPCSSRNSHLLCTYLLP